MPIRILVLGSNGIVGNDISRKIKDTYDVKSYGHNELDITDFDHVGSEIKKFKPNLVINSAAYTNVEKAEKEKRLCYEVNADAVENLSKVCHIFKSTLIHLSTDYIFDGMIDRPYTENDLGNPINVYGDSKNRADEYVKNSKCNSIILRTSWVYGYSGNNFVKSILDRVESKDKLKIVCDQYGVPTSSDFIADIINKYLINYCVKKSNNSYNEIFNLCSSGYTSWFNFAQKIIEYASNINSKYKINIIPIKSNNYKTLARRPSYTVLSNQKISTCFDIDIQNWEYYLEYFLDRYLK